MKILSQKTRRDGKIAITLLFANGVTLRKVVPSGEAQRLQAKAQPAGRGQA